jgi:nifR3 family TIM-barrel protein
VFFPQKDLFAFEIKKYYLFLQKYKIIKLMQIGDVNFSKNPLFLAPMEDVTDSSFRFICKHYGADMMFTEFVSSDALVRDAKKTVKKLEIEEAERPIGIQIYGHLTDAMVQAAQISEQARPDLIDINFGCPVRKIATRGAGAGMLNNVPLMVEMTQAVVKAVKLPVTVKTRLGWDEDSKNIVDIAERLQDVGIAAITIHGRTRAQMYKGEADWTLIGEVKNNPRMHIPVIGNGDITSPEIAKERIDRYGVDGIMIGRATYGRPWIFAEIKHYLATGEQMPPLNIAQKVELAKLHLQKSIEYKGSPVGIFEMRRHLSNYFKCLPDFKQTRMTLVTSLDVDELLQTLNGIETRYGSTFIS